MISSGPHQTIRSKRELMQMPAVTLRLWGQFSIGPRGVPCQGLERIKSPMAPPPTSQGVALGNGSLAADEAGVAGSSEETVLVLIRSIVVSKSRDRSDLAT